MENKNKFLALLISNPLVTGLSFALIVVMGVMIMLLVMNAGNNRTILENERENRRIQQERDSLSKVNERLHDYTDSLQAENRELTAAIDATVAFADSQIAYLSRYGERIVLVREGDEVIGSMDIGSQLKIYADFLSKAEQLNAVEDSLR